jgi:hypothetical protein
VRRLISSGLAATAAALVAGGLISLGAALPASAAPAPAATVHSITITSDTPSVSASCTVDVVTNAYVSGETGYWTIKAWIDSGTCGDTVEAAITCNTTNVYGGADSEEGSSYASFAGCNSSHPTPEHGGFRILVSGTWVYHTYLYSF